MANQTTDAVVTQVSIYVVTMVCPLCHEPMAFDAGKVNVCPHCGKAFVVRNTTTMGNREWEHKVSGGNDVNKDL